MKGVEQWNQSGVDNEEGIDNASGPVEDVETSKDKRRVKTEVYSRIVGYLRPVQSWNIAKKLEFEDRKTYKGTVPERMR